ncbi:sce7726 family protein [Erysipelothrix urinaevulpis]|uniref:sce7726 family protein n=1 Tax=Erysipelothrix urinaevulpis TaxID=2683717 RepID=UPI00135A160C|nr:sce7726 family protein [Erysipelothrix urinaevulpis]
MKTIESVDANSLMKIFSKTFIKNSMTSNKKLNHKMDKDFQRIVKILGLEKQSNLTREDVYLETYNYLNKNYRNEYIYKNTLINKIIFGIHSPKTTTAITEQRVGDSILDLLIINGRAIAYEIKTELDSFSRLQSQINDYKKAFEFVSLVIPESFLEKSLEMYSKEKIGIYVLRKNNVLTEIKKPQSDRESLDTDVIFSLLRMQEYENVISNFGMPLPQKSFMYYDECRSLVSGIDFDEFYASFVQQLKNRGNKNKEELDKVPKEILSPIYSMNLTKKEYEKFHVFLSDII